MLKYRQNLESALKKDELIARISLALLPASPGSFYVCGLYIADALTGVQPGGILLACRGDTGRVCERLASETGFLPVRLVGRESVYHLIDVEGGRSITVVPLVARDIGRHLERAGFTVSAMAVDIGSVSRELIDPLGGLDDLDGKRLRPASPESIAADAARTLLAVELCGRYGLEPEDENGKTLVSSAAAMKGARPGRAFSMLARVMGGGGLKKKAILLRRLGVLEALFPEVEEIFDIPQNYHHHLGAWEHTLEVMDILEGMMETPSRAFKTHGLRVALHLRGKVEAGVDRRAFLALAALIHDIGKALTMTVEPTGRIRFQGHERESARLTDGIARRLGLGYRGRSHLVGLVGGHMRFGYLVKEGESTESRLRAVRELGGRCPEVVLLSLADRLATRGEASTDEALERFRRTVTRAINDYYWLADSAPVISGYDVIVHGGVGPGPEVGMRLFEIRVAQKEGTVSSRKQALEYLAPDFKGRISGRG